MKIPTSILLLLGINTLIAQARFENQAAQLGADIIFGSVNLGAGISFYDYNNDGLDDITMAASNSENFRFLRNVGGTFTEDDLGIDSNGFRSRQVIWVDFDNDGDADFFSASDQDLSRLYRNDSGIFTDITMAAGLPGVVYPTFGASWGDYNNDGYLDLFMSIRDGSQAIPNILYRNNGDGTFSNVTASSGLETVGYISFCASFVDFDKDGFQDIYVANDKFYKPNLMYHNNGNGTFDNISISSGTNVSMDAMSTAIGDYNLDGLMDIYVTNTYPPPSGGVAGNALLRNNGNLTFTNVALATGTEFNALSWGAVFLDADNEGYPDLYVSGELDGSQGELPSAFYENQGDATYSIPQNIGFQNDTGASFSNAIGDTDNDGYPEIIVLNSENQEMFLWKNTSEQNHNWIKIKLEGVQSNRMGIGSYIEVSAGGEIRHQYTVCGEGYLSQNSGYEFFGLNDAALIDYVRVTWLSGQVDYFEGLEVNQHITIVEGDDILEAALVANPRFTIIPNPASSRVNIDFATAVEADITLLDLSGKVLIDETLKGPGKEIDVSNLTAGIYIVRIGVGKHTYFHKLLID